jgi:hypothetical protein
MLLFAHDRPVTMLAERVSLKNAVGQVFVS